MKTGNEVRIGYVGLGNMGGALACRLQLTYPLSVYDLNAATLSRLTVSGAHACGGLSEMGEACDVVFLCLPTSDHVRAAIFGDGGLAAVLRRGSLIVDQTSGDPAATRLMAQELDAHGITLVDAPVSGGAQSAQDGTIAIMVGAGAAAWARVQPLLSAISPNIFHAGDVGAGHVIKLVNNFIHGALRLLTLEGAALAVKNGIDPAMAARILNAGSARNYYSERILGERIIHGKVEVGFSLALMLKDVKLACRLGSDSGMPMFYGGLTKELYQLCLTEMGANADVDSAALVIDRLCKTNVVPSVT